MTTQGLLKDAEERANRAEADDKMMEDALAETRQQVQRMQLPLCACAFLILSKREHCVCCLQVEAERELAGQRVLEIGGLTEQLEQLTAQYEVMRVEHAASANLIAGIRAEADEARAHAEVEQRRLESELEDAASRLAAAEAAQAESDERVARIAGRVVHGEGEQPPSL